MLAGAQRMAGVRPQPCKVRGRGRTVSVGQFPKCRAGKALGPSGHFRQGPESPPLDHPTFETSLLVSWKLRGRRAAPIS